MNKRACTTKPIPASGPVHTCSWQHYAMVDAFRTASEAWRQHYDTATNGWTTEQRQYRAAHPPPRLRDFMGGDGYLEPGTHTSDRDDDADRPVEDARASHRLAS